MENEYERIHKPHTAQSGIISPSKLRLKLAEVHNQIKKKAAGSNRSSPRTSPSRVDDDSHFFNNCLLKDSNFHLHDQDQGSSLEVEDSLVNAKLFDEVEQPKESLPAGKTQQQIGRSDSVNMGLLKTTLEEDNLDYDSNASSSSFEFHKAERAAAAHSPVSGRAFSRPVSSKWNDAEKWIMNRKTVHGGLAVKRGLAQIQASKLPGGNMGRVVPEASSDDKLLNKFSDTKRVNFCLPEHAMGLEKFSFVAPAEDSGTVIANPAAQRKNMNKFNHNLAEEASGIAIRAVCMRDMGTEMTPIASQDPSRTSTPLGATTLLRSPSSSLPSTSRRGEPTSTPADFIPVGNDHKELSGEELKLKTRREIVALGVQLGKVNIAAWASKEEKKKHNTPLRTAESKEREKLEYEKRAAAWVEVEITKHSARLKREEIQIQAWESHEKAKLEAEMRRMEAQIEQMRAHAQAKMVKKISMAKQKAEEQRIKAEARKNRFAERAAAQAEYICRTGRLPSSSSFSCCGF